MAFQTKVNIEQGFGVSGDIHLDSPTRTESLIIDSKGAAPNIVGYAFTKDAKTNIAKVGGEIAAGRVFAGILVNSKEYPLYGTTKGALEPSLAIADGIHGDMLTMGDIVVQVSTMTTLPAHYLPLRQALLKLDRVKPLYLMPLFTVIR